MILQEEKEEQAYTKSEDTGKLAFFCAALAVSLTQAGGPALHIRFFSFPFQDSGCPVLALFARAGRMLPIPWDLPCLAVCIAVTAHITCT
jgi:hypothetical protein